MPIPPDHEPNDVLVNEREDVGLTTSVGASGVDVRAKGVARTSPLSFSARGWIPPPTSNVNSFSPTTSPDAEVSHATNSTVVAVDCGGGSNPATTNERPPASGESRQLATTGNGQAIRCPFLTDDSCNQCNRYFTTVDGRTPSEPSLVLKHAKTHFNRGKLAIPSIPSTYKEWFPPHLYASCRFPDCPHRALLPRQRTPTTTNQTTQKTMLNHEARCSIIHQERQARTQARNKQQAVVLASIAVTSNRHPRTFNTSRQRAQA